MVDVLMLIMRWPEVWGGVSWSYWILGEGLCGAYRTHFLSPGGIKNVVPELCSLWPV